MNYTIKLSNSRKEFIMAKKASSKKAAPKKATKKMSSKKKC